MINIWIVRVFRRTVRVVRHTFLVFLMICLAANLAGQKSSTTAQQTYTSPDGAFEFKYPEDMVVKHEPTGANCQGNLVCVELNSDTYQGSNFGGAGFWVSKPQTGKVSVKKECLKLREYPERQAVKHCHQWAKIRSAGQRRRCDGDHVEYSTAPHCSWWGVL